MINILQILLSVTVISLLILLAIIIVISIFKKFKNTKKIRKTQERFISIVQYNVVAVVVSILLLILGYVFSMGISKLSWEYVSGQESLQTVDFTVQGITPETVEYHKTYKSLEITSFDENAVTVSDVSDGLTITPQSDISISQIDGEFVSYMDEEQVFEALASDQDHQIKGTISVTGLLNPIITTLYVIGLSLLFSVPIGIITAIYLTEYEVKGKFSTVVRFSIDTLAGIPSIIYGLFGSLLFVQILGLGMGLLSGSLTLTLMLLPTIIRTTEEALKSVPHIYREASLGLGATRLQTIFKVVLPNAVSGIVVAVILAIGRVIGESAILIFTLGTANVIPTSLVKQGASTLTVQAYMLTLESGDIEAAAAIGIVIIGIIIVLNVLAKVIEKRLMKNKLA